MPFPLVGSPVPVHYRRESVGLDVGGCERLARKVSGSLRGHCRRVPMETESEGERSLVSVCWGAIDLLGWDLAAIGYSGIVESPRA